MDLMWRLVLVLFLLFCGLELSVCAVLESVYWSTSNTKFVPGEGLTLYPQFGDKMDIVCPRPSQNARSHAEYFRVYLVTEKQLESCTVSKNDVMLLNCDKPDQDVKFTFKFQEFSPNLWGLEFSKGKNYHIISTSNSTSEGLDNLEGGVCRTKSMKLVLRFGQNPTDSSSAKDPPIRPESEHPDTPNKENDALGKVDSVPGGKSGQSVGVSGTEVALFIGVAAGAVVLLIIVVALVVFVRRRYRKHSAQCSSPMALHAVPKRGNNNNGSERSDIIFPLRTSDSFYCPHYEKVSGDYGHPVYIVQEMEPQNPANIYYKV